MWSGHFIGTLMYTFALYCVSILEQHVF